MGINKNEYDREYYQKNKEKRKAQIRERNRVAIERNRDNIKSYLIDKVCVDCGFDDWRVFQFDHLDPKNKRTEVGSMIGTAYSWESILDEINKCEVVCANCHIIRTGTTYGFYRFAS